MHGYVLGLDGGGTKTDCLLFDLEGRQLASVRGGGTNHELCDGGFRQVGTELERLVSRALSLGGISRKQVSAAVFGLSGIDTRQTEMQAKQIVVSFDFPKIEVCNDAFLGIKAAIPSGYGIAMVNGTGNSVGGIDRKGKRVQVGGLGYFTGEEGGGRNISFRILRKVYDQLFRLGRTTQLTERVLNLLAVSDIYQFAEIAQDSLRTGHVEDKALHEILFYCAEQGDMVATALLQQLGTSFACSIAGCAEHLELGGIVDVVLIGSVTLKASSPLLRENVELALKEVSPKTFRLIPLMVPPAVGAVLWAMELANPALCRSEMQARVAETIEGSMICEPENELEKQMSNRFS